MEALFQSLLSQYDAIKKLSDWSSLQKLHRIDELNQVLDKRGELIRGVEETVRQVQEKMDPDNSVQAERYRRFLTMVQEIQDSDIVMMGEIKKRMDVIRQELHKRSVLKHKAIPGYLKQMAAFA
jgi:hypothetical protein